MANPGPARTPCTSKALLALVRNLARTSLGNGFRAMPDYSNPLLESPPAEDIPRIDLKSFGDNYILSPGPDGHDRLRLLGEIHDPYTRRLLLDAGVGRGMSFVEFGCGLGSVCRWVASQGATALGVDLSSARIDAAAGSACDEDITGVEFKVGDVYNGGAQSREFDFAYCRFLLSHLTEPVEAMRAMTACLKRGGLLVCEEPDLRTISTEPHSRDYASVVDAIFGVASLRRLDYRFGRRLALHARDLGLEVRHSDAYQRHFLHGRAKGFWTSSFIEAREAFLEAGVGPARLEGWFAGMKSVDRDERVCVGHAAMHQLVARRPV